MPKLLSLVSLLVPSLALGAPLERRLHPSRVEASSFLWNDWNKFQENYHPNYLADDDPKTAWVEGARGSGKGEWVRIVVTPMEKATQVRLKIRNGYQKSKSLFKANARLKDITVKLLPGGKAQKLALTDTGFVNGGWQEVTVTQPAGPLTGVEIAVDSVFEGKKYEDLCLSDVQLLVTAETRDNPAFEKEKHKKILEWKADRANAAKLFKTAAAKSIPLLPQYRVELGAEGKEAKREGQYGDALAALELLGKGALTDTARELMTAKFTGLGAVQLAPTDKREFPRVDGFYLPEAYHQVEGLMDEAEEIELPLYDSLATLRAESLSAFDVKDAPKLGEAMSGYANKCKGEAPKTFSYARKARAIGEGAQAGKESVRALLMIQCGSVELRDGAEAYSMWQLALYDDKGQLALLAGDGYATLYEWKDGQVVRARRVSSRGGKELVVQGAR